MTTKYFLSGIAMLSAVLLFSGVNSVFAESETTNAELQDKLGNQIHDLERTNEVYSNLVSSAATDQLIADNEVLIETLESQFYALSPQRELADISDTRRAELTSMMWKLTATDHPFLSMGINSYTGEINIRLDDTKTSRIDNSLQRMAGDKIQLNITYGKDDAALQGSCPSQTGKCATIIGASKGEPDNVNDIDCTISIVATKGSGSSEIDGVVIPHHCNESHNDYYQYNKNTSSHEVGPHNTDGGWYCDCDFVKIDTRASSTGKVNDAGTDISVTYGDLSNNNAVYLIGQYSGKDFGTIVEVNQWKWIDGKLYTDLYYVKNISFNAGDSGAPIVRNSDDKYGGMNIGAGTEYINWTSMTVNYVHDWSFLKSKLGLN